MTHWSQATPEIYPLNTNITTEPNRKLVTRCIQAFLNEDTFIIAESYPEADMKKDTRQHGTKDNTTNSSAIEHSRAS